MKVCFVGHSESGFGDGPTGGSERQSALLAKHLAARGHHVVYVVAGPLRRPRVASGVRLLPAWDHAAGVRFVRAVSHRYPHLLRLLQDLDAEVYYSRGAGYHTPFVVRAARRAGATSVLALASDKDLYPAAGQVLFGVPSARLSRLIGPVAHAGYRRWGLRQADWVAVQNQEQVAACSALGLRNAVLPNLVEAPSDALLSLEPSRDVLWAGNVIEGRRSKGLAELAELAAKAPAVTFTVAGTLAGESHRPIIEDLQRLPNVDLAGPLSHGETQVLIAEHRLVVNTSPSEGFSNVMLEAWSIGRPCVTLAVNPSGLLTDDRLGVCAGGDLGTMAAAIAALLADAEARDLIGRRASRYVRETHAPDRVCAAFERLAKPDLACARR